MTAAATLRQLHMDGRAVGIRDRMAGRPRRALPPLTDTPDRGDQAWNNGYQIGYGRDVP